MKTTPGFVGFIVVVILWASGPSARTWHIRADGTGDAPTIQAGIDLAATGDSILINAGTYIENLNTNGKALLLRGSGNPEATIVDGGLRGRVLTLDSGGQVESLTLRNGRGFLDGAGIYIVGSGPALIRNNVIANNESLPPHGGGAIYCTGPLHSDVVIEFNRILGNIAAGGGGLLLATSGTVRIFVRNNVIDSNVAAERGGGILAGGASITGNLVVRNVASSTGGGIDLGGLGSEVSRNTVAYNQTTNTVENGAGISVDGAAISITNNLVVGNHSIVPPPLRAARRGYHLPGEHGEMQPSLGQRHRSKYLYCGPFEYPCRSAVLCRGHDGRDELLHPERFPMCS